MTTIKASERIESVVVYLGLGANTGNPVETVLQSFKQIKKTVLAGAELSGIYRTEPQDVINQPDFINAACRGFFSGSPLQLLESISCIEQSFGRNRPAEQRRGPRPIDIDILLFGEYIINYNRDSDGSPGSWLVIPHERLNRRLFAIAPLLELNPDLTDPLSGSKLSLIAQKLQEQDIKKLAM